MIPKVTRGLVMVADGTGGEAPGAVTGGGGSLSRRIGTSLIREGLCIAFYLLINSHVLRMQPCEKSIRPSNCFHN